jgi:hypothetical protein
MTGTIETKSVVLFDDKSAVEAFVKKGWLEKVVPGDHPEDFWCRYTPKGREFQAVISRFEAS